MRQLAPLDVQFLNVEDATTVAHVGALVILDPSTTPTGQFTVDDLLSLLGKRIHLAPQLRRRLADVPLGIAHPYWIEDPDLDLEYHVRETAIPAPGSDAQLAEHIAHLAAIPLDRRRPLWEAYLVQGLSGGRLGFYTKVHHAAIDGVSGAEIIAILMDLTPEPRTVDPEARPPRPESPGRLELLSRGMFGMATDQLRRLRTLPRALPHLVELPGAANVPGARLLSELSGKFNGLTGLGPSTIDEAPPSDAPRTPFNGPITRHRRFAFGSLPLAEVKAVKQAFGMTVNDVVMAMCASALRRWLAEHEALPDAPLIAGMPVSVRSEDERTAGGNKVSVMLAELATEIADPKERLLAVRAAIQRAKQRFDALPASLLQDYSAMLPAALSGLAMRAAFRLVNRSAPAMNLLISNVPGPQFPLYALGARVLGLYPVSVISEVTGGINITLFSYDGNLDFGVIVCREMVPDVWTIIDYLADGLRELRELAE